MYAFWLCSLTKLFKVIKDIQLALLRNDFHGPEADGVEAWIGVRQLGCSQGDDFSNSDSSSQSGD